MREVVARSHRDLNDIALTEVDLIARTMARVIITCLSHSRSLNISTLYIVYAHICYCNKVMYMHYDRINYK